MSEVVVASVVAVSVSRDFVAVIAVVSWSTVHESTH